MKRLLLITAAAALISVPLHAKNNFKQGNEYYLDKKYDKALEKYSGFVKKNPDYYEGYYNAGNSLFKQGKYKEALSMYKKARELKPDDPDIEYNIKVAEKKLKEKQKQQKQQQKDKGGGKKQEDKGAGQQEDKKQGKGKGEKQEAGKENAGQKNGGSKKAAGGKQKREDKGSAGKQAMTDDEVQALLNLMQKQEKKYRNYFGKKYRRKKGVYDFPDFFNMSPEEIMEYMDRKMMDPFEERKQGGGKEQKDW